MLLATILAAVQAGSQPTIVLTIFGGMTMPHDLWDVTRQPFCLLQGSGSVQSCTSSYDTLRLTRSITRSLVGGAVGSYFPGHYVGYTVEVSYLGLPPNDHCTGVFVHTDPRGDSVAGPRNAQLCDNISAASLSISAIAVLAGVTVRAAPRRPLGPFLRVGVGLVTYTAGTIEMAGSYFDSAAIRSRAVYLDDRSRGSTISWQIAGGFTYRFKPGYQVRLELRDVLLPLRRVTGPSNDRLVPPTRTRIYHGLALTAGLDVVLEKRRGRRY